MHTLLLYHEPILIAAKAFTTNDVARQEGSRAMLGIVAINEDSSFGADSTLSFL